MKKPSEQIRDIALSIASATDVSQLGLPVIVKAMHQWLDAEAERALPKPVVCPECTAAGTKSKIVNVHRGGARTAMYYAPQVLFDEDGREHHHDENRQAFATGYECAAGHRFTVRGITPCWCGWGSDKERCEPTR